MKRRWEREVEQIVCLTRERYEEMVWLGSRMKRRYDKGEKYRIGGTWLKNEKEARKRKDGGIQ